MSNNKESSDKTEIRRRLAFLALAAEQREEATGDCPGQEMWAVFLEGEVAVDEQQAVLAHISRCEACYQRWLELSRELERADQDGSGVGAVLKRRWWLSGAGSIGAIALGIMLFLSLDYRVSDQRPVGTDALQTVPQAVSPSARMEADEHHRTAEEQEVLSKTQSQAKTGYSAPQPVQPTRSAEPAADAERTENNKAEGFGYGSPGAVLPPAPTDADRIQPAQRRARQLALADRLSGPAADVKNFIELASGLCEDFGKADAPMDSTWAQRLQMLLGRGRALLDSGAVEAQQRSEVEAIMEIVEAENGAASVDRDQLCRRLAPYLLRSTQPEQ
jgi:hypothetical protein